MGLLDRISECNRFDLLMRHGVIAPTHPEYLALARGVHG